MIAPRPSIADTILKVVLQNFHDRVDRSAGPGACWPWNGNTHRFGYGKFQLFRLVFSAHRVAWEAASGPIPDGLFVCHRCDNPPCCNPAHLFLGTATDNNRDMRKKRRNYRSKFTEDQVVSIRKRVEEGEKRSDIATEFGVTKKTIQRIVERSSWSDVA